MTSIVAISTPKGVYLGGDLAGSNGHTIGTTTQSKVCAKEDFLIGYTGSFRAGQIVEHGWYPPARVEGISDYIYLVLAVIPSMMECLTENGYGGHDGEEVRGGNFVLVYRGHIYEVQTDYSIIEWDQPVVCVGSGGDVTEAACNGMLIMNELLPKTKKVSVEDIITTALEITSEKIVSVRGCGTILFQEVK